MTTTMRILLSNAFRQSMALCKTFGFIRFISLAWAGRANVRWFDNSNRRNTEESTIIQVPLVSEAERESFRRASASKARIHAILQESSESTREIDARAREKEVSLCTTSHRKLHVWASRHLIVSEHLSGSVIKRPCDCPNIYLGLLRDGKMIWRTEDVCHILLIDHTRFRTEADVRECSEYPLLTFCFSFLRVADDDPDNTVSIMLDGIESRLHIITIDIDLVRALLSAGNPPNESLLTLRLDQIERHRGCLRYCLFHNWSSIVSNGITTDQKHPRTRIDRSSTDH